MKIGKWRIGKQAELDQMQQATAMLIEYVKQGPGHYPPEVLIGSLKELDSRTIDLLLRQLQYGSTSVFQYQATEEDRLMSVYSSRRMHDNDPIAEACLRIWTDFGFGLKLSITPENDNAKDFWDAFWKADENSYLLSQRKIHELSIRVLRDGDFLFVLFTNTLDGTSRIRIVQTEQIKGGSSKNGIIAMPEDALIPVLYRREITKDGLSKIIYYRDWLATDEMVAEVGKPEDGEIEETTGTQIRAIHVAHNPHDMRGWPLLTTGLPWLQAYKEFLQDRAAVAKAINMYVDKIKAEGGQKAIDAIASKLQSAYVTGGSSETNPTPTAGSTWLENTMATRERLPMGSGASDAEIDGTSILAQAGAAASIYPHYVGRGANVYRLATSESMELPLLKAMNRYQLFWASVWEDVAKYVLRAGEQFGGQAFDEDYAVRVFMNSIITISTEDIARAGQTLYDAFDRGLVEEAVAAEITEQILRQDLQTIGVDNIDDIMATEPEAVPEPEVPEAPPEVTPPVPPGEELPAIVPATTEAFDKEFKRVRALWKARKSKARIDG
jgi:hypothetical protein